MLYINVIKFSIRNKGVIMAKCVLHLSIDSDLYNYIKNYKEAHTEFNISAEVEEWIRIRMNVRGLEQEVKTVEQIDQEKARHLLEIRKLESEKELAKRQEQDNELEVQLIDHIIDNEMETSKAQDIPANRARGLKYLMLQRFNKTITEVEAQELLEARVKQRGLIA